MLRHKTRATVALGELIRVLCLPSPGALVEAAVHGRRRAGGGAGHLTLASHMRGDVGPARGLAAKLGRAVAQRHVVDSTGKLISHDCGWWRAVFRVGGSGVLCCVFCGSRSRKGGRWRGSGLSSRTKSSNESGRKIGGGRGLGTTKLAVWQSSLARLRKGTTEKVFCGGCSTNSHKLAEMQRSFS